jgi:hypothetical protein
MHPQTLTFETILRIGILVEMASPTTEISNTDGIEPKKLLNHWLSSNFVLSNSLDIIFEQQVAEAREGTRFTSIGHGFCAEVGSFLIFHS